MWIITSITQGEKIYFKGFEIPGVPNYTSKQEEAIKFMTKKEAVYYNKQYAKGTVEKTVGK